MNWEKLINIEKSTKKNIEYIYLQIGEDKEESYTKIKEILRKKYKSIKDKDEDKLKEIYNTFYYKKIALESINPENLTVGMISIIGIIVAILAIGISIAMSSGQVNEVLDYKFFVNSYLFLLFILIILTGSMGLLRYRIKDKSRKMVYYTIVIEVLEELLDSKNDSKSIEIENVLD